MFAFVDFKTYPKIFFFLGFLKGPNKSTSLPPPPPPFNGKVGLSRTFCMPSSVLRFVFSSDPYFLFPVLSVLPNKFPFIL